ncbi:MAG: hypothetical protein H7320_11005 [Ferruginibacter sp.]|nr:hypothetical protein [Ferruginibacter sp.]
MKQEQLLLFVFLLVITVGTQAQNVGIGTPAPGYKLDVVHGGGTGIRSKSTAGFSVLDIDAFSGEAALRFFSNGTQKMLVRTNPANNDFEFYRNGSSQAMRIDNATGKVWVLGDFTVLGTKAFTMDHPLDPANKLLVHAAAESNEVINFYSGNIVTDANGKATVKLPDYFEAINKDFRYQLTVVGVFAQAIISKEVSNNQFEIAANVPNVKVSWEVKGVRNDAHMKRFPFKDVLEKDALMKGTYVDPAAHDLPASRAYRYQSTQSSIGETVIDLNNN